MPNLTLFENELILLSALVEWIKDLVLLKIQVQICMRMKDFLKHSPSNFVVAVVKDGSITYLHPNHLRGLDWASPSKKHEIVYLS